jgi:hypothetical protein
VQFGDHIRAYILCLEFPFPFAFLLFAIYQQSSYSEGMVEFDPFVVVEILYKLHLLYIRLVVYIMFLACIAEVCDIRNHSLPMIVFMHHFPGCI